MDMTTILMIGGVILLIALFLFNRNRPAARGTYDDKKARSSGSIGGGTRAYDEPESRSSGSIGGGAGNSTRAYDSPDHKSSGSIDGDNRGVSVSQKPRTDAFTPSGRLGTQDQDKETRRRDPNAKQDDDKFKSGGSFGG